MTARLSRPVDRDRGQAGDAELGGEPAGAGVMLWVQTSRWVPASSSRAISGAPQNAPMTGGAAYSSDLADDVQQLVEPLERRGA